MPTIEHIGTQLNSLLEAGEIAEAEQTVDDLAWFDLEDLETDWGLPEDGVRHYLSIFYNNIGLNYRIAGMEAVQEGNREAAMEAAQGSERCHEKALDIYDLSAEEFMIFPSDSPINKNLIFTFWGLGGSKLVLGKTDESRKYLELCLRIPAEDEQAAAWQSEAGNYLRTLDQRAIRLVLKAQEVIPTLSNPQLLRVEGEVLECDAYTPPTQPAFPVYVDDEDIKRLEAQGVPNAIALEGHILVLESDESGDLRHPLHIVEVM